MGVQLTPPPQRTDLPTQRSSPPPFPHTFCQPVWDLCLVFAAHPDLPLIGQKRFLDGVEHQRVEEAVLGGGRIEEGGKKGV